MSLAEGRRNPIADALGQANETIRTVGDTMRGVENASFSSNINVRTTSLSATAIGGQRRVSESSSSSFSFAASYSAQPNLQRGAPVSAAANRCSAIDPTLATSRRASVTIPPSAAVPRPTPLRQPTVCHARQPSRILQRFDSRRPPRNARQRILTQHLTTLVAPQQASPRRLLTAALHMSIQCAKRPRASAKRPHVKSSRACVGARRLTIVARPRRRDNGKSRNVLRVRR